MDALAGLPGWAIALAVALVVYVGLLAGLVVAGRRLLARELALLLPNLFRLFRGLLADPRVPLRAKVVLAIGIVWIASPIDLIPEFVPVAGPLDDAIVAALVLAYVSRTVGRDVVREHWQGDPTILARLMRLPDVVRSVLFLCVGNSCRSQMAEGLLRHLGGDRFDVHSAGVIESHLRPETVEAMREIGIDISGQRSKKADVYAGRGFDLVVTTCDEAKEACPLFPGAGRTIHWSIPDPVGRGPAAYRAARNQLRQRIENELIPPPRVAGGRSPYEEEAR